MPRRSGILLHLSSLPGPYGIGDLGDGAAAFLAWLAAAGQSLWQFLPLGPHGPLGSPYGAWSTFAGNPLLLSPERLAEAGLLRSRDLAAARCSQGPVDFTAVSLAKSALLRRAWRSYCRHRPPELEQRLAALAEEPGLGAWLEDWTLFAALKDRLDGQIWSRWPEDLRRREPGALRRARGELADDLEFHRFVQLLFLDQWLELRRRAEELRIALFGDIAIYVALDSADVWAHQELFDLDGNGRPRAVAGVPPDYFSPTGQLWGNPLYRWDRLQDTGYAWWIERLAWSLRLVDVVRIDHFRGFAGYWEVPAEAKTAIEGCWRPGPGRAPFEALREALGDLPIVAEDLGVITEDVRALRRQLGIPGMRVLQFAFAERNSEHLPHRMEPDVVVYTGTHDNDTARGWLATADDEERRRVELYVKASEADIHWDLIRAALTSVADTAVVPLQDVLGLGTEARMNRPGAGSGQWTWRLGRLPSAARAARLRELTEVSGRLPPAVADGRPFRSAVSRETDLGPDS